MIDVELPTRCRGQIATTVATGVSTVMLTLKPPPSARSDP